VDSFVGGVAMGFAIAAPVGPIGILCLRRAVVGGFFAGLSSGLGAACADAAYAALALGALTFVAAVIARLMVPLHLVGGVALILLGLRTACSVLPRASGDVVSARAGWRALVTTFGLTIVNPATILSFGAVVAAAQFGRGVDGRGAAALVVGVFVGSALWWCVLSAFGSIVRRAISPAVMRAIDVGSGAALGAFGVWALASA
jgi:putative LysE/RhtB family amino acid efflux pump